MTDENATPEPPTPRPVAPAEDAPTTAAAPVVPPARPQWRERFHGTLPALAVFGAGTLFGTVLHQR